MYRFDDNKNYPRNTKERIFVPESFTPRIDRMTHLANRSNGYKHYNILTNASKDYNYQNLRNSANNGLLNHSVS